MCSKYCVVSVVKALDLEPKRKNCSQCRGQHDVLCRGRHYLGANSFHTDGPCNWTPAPYQLGQGESTFCSLLAAACLFTNTSSEGKPLFTLILKRIERRRVWPLPVANKPRAAQSARSHSRSPEPRGTTRSRVTGPHLYTDDTSDLGDQRKYSETLMTLKTRTHNFGFPSHAERGKSMRRHKARSIMATTIWH